MPNIPWGGTAITYDLYHPGVMNQGVHRAWTGGLTPSETFQYTWVDPTKLKS